MSTIELAGVIKAFGDQEVIRSIDLTIPQGELVVLLGPSGCGKSTLLRLIAGLEDVTGGRILIDGRDVTRTAPARRGLAMVFQSYALYPHMTVAANIGFPLKMAGLSKAEIARRVGEVATTLGLTPYLSRKPSALSGGQRQRVGIGRALVREPVAFLFDEPLSNLDAAMRASMRLEIRRLQQSLGTTAVYVTHDQVEAMTMADRIVVLLDGAVKQVGTPLELYRQPADRFVATFVGSPKMNILEGKLAADHGAAVIGVRAEDIRLASDGPWKGEVVSVEHLGSDTFVYVAIADGTVVCARTAADFDRAPGASVGLSPAPERLHRFGSDGRVMRTRSAWGAQA